MLAAVCQCGYAIPLYTTNRCVGSSLRLPADRRSSICRATGTSLVFYGTHPACRRSDRSSIMTHSRFARASLVSSLRADAGPALPLDQC